MNPLPHVSRRSVAIRAQSGLIDSFIYGRALTVNWCEIQIRNAAGTLTYQNSFITNLPVGRATVAERVACGRARWKIENESFNTLKTAGYHLEHNFGHASRALPPCW